MYKRITIQEAKELLEAGALCVDIRDPASYEAGHIPDAVLLNNDNLETFLNEADLSKTLLVCCYHGNSSQGAAQFLHEKGFTEAYSIDGGYEAWKLDYPSE